jgi:hypothetical protein
MTSCCIGCLLEASFVRRHTQLYGVDSAVSDSLQSLLLLLLSMLPALTACAGDAAAARQKSDKAETPGDCSAQGKPHHYHDCHCMAAVLARIQCGMPVQSHNVLALHASPVWLDDLQINVGEHDV